MTEPALAAACARACLQRMVFGLCLLLPLPLAAASGQALFEARCGVCHELPDPRSMSTAMWVEQLAAMAPLADLTARQHAAVLAYLQAVAADPANDETDRR